MNTIISLVLGAKEIAAIKDRRLKIEVVSRTTIGTETRTGTGAATAIEGAGIETEVAVLGLVVIMVILTGNVIVDKIARAKMRNVSI